LADALDQSNGDIKAARPIMPEQLQFYTWLSGKLGDDRLRANLPIRVSIKYDADNWLDVPRDTAVKVSGGLKGQNLIWLDGLAEGAEGRVDCVYNGSLLSAPDLKANFGTFANAMKPVRINCAMQTDYRVYGIASGGASWRDGAFMAAYSGVRDIQYVDTPGSFIEFLQSDSYPAPNTKYFGGATGVTKVDGTNGLNRTVPPGNETANASYAAEREYLRMRNIRRTSSWERAGIQKGIEAGDWIDYVYVFVNGQNVNDYEVRGSVGTVTWDFLQQRTSVGGVVGEV